MTEYELYLTVHVVAAIVWLGSAFCVQLLAFRATRTGDPERQRRVAADSEWLATRVFIPSSLLVLVFGVLLVIEGPWDFGTTWVTLGLIGYAFSFLVGIVYLSPESGRIDKALAAGAMEEAQGRIARITLVSRIELVILFLVVVVMTTKPS
jgi:uncharacterized membrane protein